MTRFPLSSETDAVRHAILAAMNRLFEGAPQRSSGRLNISQLAVEAGVKRWHLTHQHTDLKDLFQAEAAREEAARPSHAKSVDELTELKKKHKDLQAHSRYLEQRLQLYASALNLMALESAALSGQGADLAKVRMLPAQRCHKREGRHGQQLED